MSPRALRATLAALILVVLLFAGRWTAGLLAERWWAGELSPAAVHFVSRWMVLSLILEILGVTIACAWFVGHLLLICRAIGSVQVHRRLANLEIREAVNMRAIAWLSIGGGLVLGFISGRGVGDWTGPLLLGWRGLQYGEADPLLGRELGFYLVRLPVWRLFHGYATLLTVTALGGAAVLYTVIGAVRWVDQRPAINDHARRHLGGLAALLALVLAWGYLLEPSELVGGLNGSVHEGLFEFRRTVALLLTGTAIAAALLSFLWALRGRSSVVLAIWGLLGMASLLGHYLLPALIGPNLTQAMDAATRRHLDQLAYGMAAMRDSALQRRDVPPDPPRPAALWHATIAAQATAADSGRVVAADRALVTVGRRQRPVWLVVRDRGSQGAGITVLLDDQTTPTGLPIVFHDADSLRTQKVVPTLRLPPRASWPRGEVSVVDTAPGGVEVGSGLRRLVLAWALQSAQLLGPASGDRRVFWHLDPVERCNTLAPFAVWGAPAPRYIGGELVWLVDGYLPSGAFPGSTRVRWRGRSVGALRAGFIGVVHAETGKTTLYLRHTADEVAKEWRALTDSLIQPSSALPSEILRALPYPAELLEAQVRVLSEPHWGLGQVIGRPEGIGVTGPSDEALWEPDTTGVQIVFPYERAQQRQVAAVVRAHVADGWELLSVFRVDSLLSLPDPTGLQAKWARFPTFQQIKDSVEKDGGRLEPGPTRYWTTSVGLGAYQPSFAQREGQDPAMVWVSLAIGDRRGAGHDLEEAWQNLLGLSAPIIAAGERGSALFEARRYLQAAEAALRRGDLEGFGRAWEALKRTIRAP
jgi:uncharacterized protein